MPSPRPIAEELWCLGDLVGYGADPDACVDLARENAAICLAGNHDLGVRGTIPLEQFSRGAALAATWTQQTISPETREYLDSLEPQNSRRRSRCITPAPATRSGSTCCPPSRPSCAWTSRRGGSR